MGHPVERCEEDSGVKMTSEGSERGENWILRYICRSKVAKKTMKRKIAESEKREEDRRDYKIQLPPMMYRMINKQAHQNLSLLKAVITSLAKIRMDHLIPKRDQDSSMCKC